jgi:hypothetical protein
MGNQVKSEEKNITIFSITKTKGKKNTEKILNTGAQNNDSFSAKYIAKVFGNISPKKSIRILLIKIARNKPLSPKVFTKRAVEREVIPILTNVFPKLMAERVCVGLERRFLTVEPWEYFS